MGAQNLGQKMEEEDDKCYQLNVEHIKKDVVKVRIDSFNEKDFGWLQRFEKKDIDDNTTLTDLFNIKKYHPRNDTLLLPPPQIEINEEGHKLLIEQHHLNQGIFINLYILIKDYFKKYESDNNKLLAKEPEIIKIFQKFIEEEPHTEEIKLLGKLSERFNSDSCKLYDFYKSGLFNDDSKDDSIDDLPAPRTRRKEDIDSETILKREPWDKRTFEVITKNLGLDINEDKDKNMLWIVEEAANAPIPITQRRVEYDDTEKDEDSEPLIARKMKGKNVYYYYWNKHTEKSSWTHPMEHYYKELVTKLKGGYPLEIGDARTLNEHHNEANLRVLRILTEDSEVKGPTDKDVSDSSYSSDGDEDDKGFEDEEEDEDGQDEEDEGGQDEGDEEEVEEEVEDEKSNSQINFKPPPSERWPSRLRNKTKSIFSRFRKR